MFENLFTIGVCFYQTPNLVLPFLKSWVYHHPKDNFKILISENSKDDQTVQVLNQNNLGFLRNPGMRHAPAIDVLLDNCKTKFLILCDSDILIRKPVTDLMQLAIEKNLTCLGSIQGSRGGYNLYDRLDPSFLIIDVEKIREKKIKFYDPVRIDETCSNGFFGNIPLQVNHGKKYWDVGGTFLADILYHNLKVGKINQKIDDYRTHYEGMSWRKFSGIKGYEDWGSKVEQEYFENSKHFERVDLKDKFKNE